MATFTVLDVANETAGLDSAARSSILRLNHGKNRIWVWSAAWDGTKKAALKYAPKNDDAALGVVKEPDGVLEFTENDGCDLLGPGFVCFDLTDPDGNPVYMSVSQCEIM